MAFAPGMAAPRTCANHEHGQPAGDQADGKQEKKTQAVRQATADFPGQNPGVCQRINVHYRKYHEGADTCRQERYPDYRRNITFLPAPAAGYGALVLLHLSFRLDIRSLLSGIGKPHNVSSKQTTVVFAECIAESRHLAITPIPDGVFNIRRVAAVKPRIVRQVGCA
jgi:hypothetical protein